MKVQCFQAFGFKFQPAPPYLACVILNAALTAAYQPERTLREGQEPLVSEELSYTCTMVFTTCFGQGDTRRGQYDEDGRAR